MLTCYYCKQTKNKCAIDVHGVNAISRYMVLVLAKKKKKRLPELYTIEWSYYWGKDGSVLVGTGQTRLACY